MVLDISDLTLWTSPDKFFFVSEDKPGQLLIIDRITHSISLERNRHQIPMTVCARRAISGILGILELMSGPHLVVITAKSRIGHLTSDNHAVWKLDHTELIPFARSDFHLGPAERVVNEEQRQLVESLLNNNVHQTSKCFFFFSHTIDLSNSMQKLDTISENYQGPAHFLSTVSQSFTWNFSLLKKNFLPRPELHSWCVPIVEGACFIQQCSLNGKLFRWSLISRRSTQMAGTRFNKRGADQFGNVANFVETEQLVEHGDVMTSFVQTRGSMPMFWSQVADLSYLPKPAIHRHAIHLQPFLSHFQNQFVRYGHQVAVNLINQHGSESSLEQLFRHLHSECLRMQACCTSSQVPNLDHLDSRMKIFDYEPFDFHANCPNLRDWKKLDLLKDKIRNRLHLFGFYARKSRGGTAMLLQRGVFRTNCMDCLDRSNVVQSIIAWENLTIVLNLLGILKSGDSLSSHLEFQNIFRNVWSDHANTLALQYVGSRALKTDFTRTGQRSFQGALVDLKNAVVRYWSNNFVDGKRQDAIDIFLGNVDTKNLPLTDEVFEAVENSDLSTIDQSRYHRRCLLRYLPIVLVATGSLLFLTISAILLIVDSDADDWVQLKDLLLIVIFLSSFSLLSILTILRNSNFYVDHPKYSQKNLKHQKSV